MVVAFFGWVAGGKTMKLDLTHVFPPSGSKIVYCCNPNPNPTGKGRMNAEKRDKNRSAMSNNKELNNRRL